MSENMNDNFPLQVSYMVWIQRYRTVLVRTRNLDNHLV